MPNTAVLVQLAVALGPCSWNSIVPVGLAPPARVAVSVTVVPTVAPPLGLVAMAGEALLMATDSAPQPEAAGLLALSPP